MDINSKEYRLHKFPFGKYKGLRISEFYGLRYLEWLYESTKLDDITRQVIGLRIYQLSNPKSYKI